MVRFSRLTCMMLATAILSSCEPPKIQVVVGRVGGNLRANFFQDFGILFSRRRSPCVGEVGLYSPGTYTVPDALWLVEANGKENCIDLGSVIIGKVPRGFRQVVPFKAHTGGHYTLRVHGEGYGSADLTL